MSWQSSATYDGVSPRNVIYPGHNPNADGQGGAKDVITGYRESKRCHIFRKVVQQHVRGVASTLSSIVIKFTAESQGKRSLT